MTRTAKATTFPERLRAAREQAGMSQAELAHAIGRGGRQDIAKIESRAAPKLLRTIEELADALKVPRAWLAFGDLAVPRAFPGPIEKPGGEKSPTGKQSSGG